MMHGRLFLSLIAVWVIAAGCASTKIVNSWRSPEYAGGPLASLLVVGVSTQASVRRVFEDVFAGQLEAQGVQAKPSYQLIPEDGPVPEERLRAAAEQSGTDGVIITRLVKVDTQLAISPGYVPPPAVPPYYRPYYYGYYSYAWLGYYEPPTVYQYAVVTSETTVFLLDRPDPIWSGTTETFSPRDVRKEAATFARVVLDALAREGLVPQPIRTEAK
jgi:hypothetical protein